MQITETRNEGLRREFRVVIERTLLDQKLTAKLEEMRPQMHLKGFRPGKAPLAHLKRTFGKAVMGDIVNEAVAETSQKAVADNAIRVAMQPAIKFETEIDQVVLGSTDLVYAMEIDVMPDFQPADLATVELVRPTAEVSGEEIDAVLKRMADQQKTYEAKDEGEAAETGDQVVIDFEGRVDGETFAGGKAENSQLVLGSGSFIPGFEEQLTGAKAGQHRKVSVRFPDDYGAANLAGKDAVFDVTVHQVLRPVEAPIDDEFARKLGLESLDRLRDAVNAQLAADFSRASRSHLKRAILDALDERHDFALPAAMVEAEFKQIWAQVENDIKTGNFAQEDKDKSEDELKGEFEKIASRRVRLGLVLSEIGRINNVQVTQDEVNRAMVVEARRYPGQEQRIMDFFRNNPNAVAQLRAPIYEDKVVDFLCTQIKITDKTVSREDLFRDPDDLNARLTASA